MLTKIKKDRLFLFLFCIVVVLISLLPFYYDYVHIHLGMDEIYHINRIEGYAQSISEFNFFPRFYADKVNGYGYIGPTFYSDIFLIFPAVLYNLNVPIIVAYNINVVFISLLTAFSMAFCVYKMTDNIKISSLATFLYVFSEYRLMDIYSRGALGELYGFIFFPIIIYALYKMINFGECQTRNLVIAFSGLLLSHNISFFIGVFFFGVSLLFFIKKIVTNKTVIFSIIKAVLITLGICCFYWAPLLEMTVTQDFVFRDGLNRTYELKSATVGFIDIFNYTVNGFNDHTNKITIGIMFIISPLVFIFSKFKQKDLFYNFLFGFGIFLIFMTTYYFPWDYFGFFATIQFPWRLLTIASACLSIATAKLIIDFLSKKIQYLFIGIILVISISYVYQVSLFEKTFDDNATYEEIVSIPVPGKCLENNDVTCYSSSWELAQGNYLNKLSQGRENWDYVITNVSHSVISDQILFDGKVTGFEVDMSIENEFIVFPINYYLGITAEATDINNRVYRLETSMDLENAQVRVKLNNPDFRGTIRVWYEGTAIQKYSIGISYIFVMGCLLYIVGDRTRKIN